MSVMDLETNDGHVVGKEDVLQADHVTMRFGGLTAVNDVSMTVHQGEIVGLIGPNGAGKTTTVEIAEGFRRSSRSPSRPRPFSRWPPAANSTSGPSPCRA